MCITGAGGSSREGQSGVGGFLDRRWGRWGRWGRLDSSGEHTTRFDEHTCSSSRNSVCWGADSRRGLSGAWVAVSRVVVAGWVLDTALVVVSRGVVAAVGAVVDDDVALAVGGSGPERRGWERCCGAVGRLGGVCHRFRGVWGWFGAGEGVVVVVNDDDGVVDVVDGGCAGVVSGDVADGMAGRGMEMGG